VIDWRARARRGPVHKGFSIRIALGIDVGGSKVALCVGDESGRLLASRRRPTEPSGDAARDVARLVDDARALLAEAGLAPARIDAVGVSLPGPLDPRGLRVVNPPNLPGWRDVPVRALLADALGRPVFLENDANAAALAEWRFGAGRGFASLVYLTLSTGLGGGVILDGRLVRGRNWSTGEIGHLPLVWNGEPCACGLRGCAEAYLGGRAWAKRLAATTPPGSRVAALAAGAGRAPTPVELVAAAREGDAFACAELARWNEHLAQVIAIVAMTLDPDAVLLGTIAAAAGELVLAPVRAAVAAHVWPRIAEGLAILPAALGERQPYYAGLCAALDGCGAETPAA
jgi:glucokinase